MTDLAVGERERPSSPGASGFHRTGWMLFFIDLGAALAAAVTALAIRLETTDPAIALEPYLPAALLPLAVRPLVYIAFGLHRREWKHASLRELADLLTAVGVGSLIILPMFVALNAMDVPGTSGFPRSFFLLEPLFFFALTTGARLLVRTGLERAERNGAARGHARPSLIYGAGNAGAVVARMAQSGSIHGIRVVGVLDDDPRKRGSRLLGHRVLGSLDDIEKAVERTGATQLIVAIPSGRAEPVRKAVAAASALSLAIKTVPPLRDLITGGYHVAGIRSVGLEDLLRREPVRIDATAIAETINGASVVVTGGGGSIGGELVRQIMILGPRVLTVVDYHEWALWSLERDVAAMRRESDGGQFVAALADVRSQAAMDAVMRRARPDIVFHAAALKHVPYVELFPAEGVLTNVVGTRNVLRACDKFGVGTFVLISTDKAVEPVSVMGATKRLAEQLTVAAGHRTGRACVAVRFGNVLGSSGSVVPLLQRQLDDGLPLTITQPDATRFFMTITEAVSLILEAASNPASGEIFVLDMGEPIRIIDLARDLVRLNGVDPDTVSISVTGLRPGERLHEKAFYDDEVAERTSHPGILRASYSGSPVMDRRIEALVDRLAGLAEDHDDDAVRALLHKATTITSPNAAQELEAVEMTAPTEVVTLRSIGGRR